MRRRVILSGFGVWLAVLAVFPAPAAFAQNSSAASSISVRPVTTIPISPRAPAVDELLRRGHQLEIEQRWGEALTHYEDSLRRFPREDSLQRRFDHTRLHYDLDRRYSDRSFCEAVATLPAEEALDLYSQVLLKIQAHYVEIPKWKQLIECGTNNFEVALSEQAFLQRNVPEEKQSKADKFRQELRRSLGPRVVESRKDARAAVATAAEAARRELDVPPTAVVLEYLCGAMNSLDPYSAYLTPVQLQEVYAQIEGNFVGLGIELKATGEDLLIVRVISGSPADEGGIRAGDQIISVDGQATRNYSTDRAANLLQGEEGSVVELTVVAPPQPPRSITVRRRRVEVPSVDNVKIVDRNRGIAYLRLVCFQKTTSGDLEAALWKLHRKGMKSLIIDLRGNPGGLLVTAVEVVDKFVDRGIIVSTRGRSTQEDFVYSAHAAGTWRVPLVVLIDRDSASAAEIFAGAIRDHRRGTIVGTRSYGKGSVQGIFPLQSSTAGVRLTTARFYSPMGRPYGRVGVDPNVAVHLSARPIDGNVTTLPLSDDDDPMLAAAVQAARTVRKQR